jgi:hypothetical protein
MAVELVSVGAWLFLSSICSDKALSAMAATFTEIVTDDRVIK